jgi:hypothetical protein
MLFVSDKPKIPLACVAALRRHCDALGAWATSPRPNADTGALLQRMEALKHDLVSLLKRPNLGTCQDKDGLCSITQSVHAELPRLHVIQTIHVAPVKPSMKYHLVIGHVVVDTVTPDQEGALRFFGGDTVDLYVYLLRYDIVRVVPDVGDECVADVLTVVGQHISIHEAEADICRTFCVPVIAHGTRNYLLYSGGCGVLKFDPPRFVHGNEKHARTPAGLFVQMVQ